LLRLGLTGGIGSGKSTVARLLEALGAKLIDADQIARECTLSGGLAMSGIARQFGPDFVTPEGAMDRQRMRDHVFAHPQARVILESIIHPMVQQEMRRLSNLFASQPQVFDVPLLAESGHWRLELDRILVVDCTHATQILRVQARNGWPQETIEAIIRQQCTREKRLAVADAVVWNDGLSLKALEQCVKTFATRFGL
jgi:dephospho-CoA kinase